MDVAFWLADLAALSVALTVMSRLMRTELRGRPPVGHPRQ